MRAKEGASLAADLRRNARSIERITARIEKRMPEVVRGHHASLRRRLDELLEGRLAPDADLTRERELLLDPATYEARSTRSMRLPGALLRALRFTL